MKPSCLLIFLMLLILEVSAQNVELNQLNSHVFNNKRNIRVYLPPGYYRSQNKYPVLYMNDGSATVDAYRLKEVTDSLIKKGLIKPLIIVGIDNGGSTTTSKNPVRDRANEYLPWPDLEEKVSVNRIAKTRGSQYPF